MLQEELCPSKGGCRHICMYFLLHDHIRVGWQTGSTIFQIITSQLAALFLLDTLISSHAKAGSPILSQHPEAPYEHNIQVGGLSVFYCFLSGLHPVHFPCCAPSPLLTGFCTVHMV